MWSVRVEMIGCQPVEMWWWQGCDVRVNVNVTDTILWQGHHDSRAIKLTLFLWHMPEDRGRKTWREWVKDDMDELGLHSEWVVFRDMWVKVKFQEIQKLQLRF